MKTRFARILPACAAALLVLSPVSCSHFEGREDDKPDRDPADGVYAPNFVLEKMEEQRKTGKWKSEYE